MRLKLSSADVVAEVLKTSGDVARCAVGVAHMGFFRKGSESGRNEANIAYSVHRL